LVYSPPVREGIIGPFTDGLTVAAGGGLITLFGGQAWVQGNVLAIPGFSVRILDAGRHDSACLGRLIRCFACRWARRCACRCIWGYGGGSSENPW
ncbi:MAG: hypothetical protein NHG36_08990, partial [Chromatiaceae bacterium]|nr:hypothetical protein [Candidatus Thioaporhodococcus sediminis]